MNRMAWIRFTELGARSIMSMGQLNHDQLSRIQAMLVFGSSTESKTNARLMANKNSLVLLRKPLMVAVPLAICSETHPAPNF